MAFAHRGARSRTVDENTNEALEAAYGKRASMETDVWLTEDDDFLVIHDETLDHTTGCKGYVDQWLMADIQAECRTEPNGQRIPDFNSLLDVLSDNAGQRLMVEIKGDGWYHDDNAPLERLHSVAAQAGVLDRVYFTNDAGTGTVETLRDVAPTARTAWKPAPDETITLERAEELSVDAVVAPADEWTSRALVQSFRSEGFLAWSRAVDDEATWKRLIRRGVAGVMTHRSGAFLKVCTQMGS